MAVSNGFNYGIDSSHINPFWQDQSNSGGSGVKSIRDWNVMEEVDGDVVMGVFTDYKVVDYEDVINAEHVVNLNRLGRIVSGYPGMVLRIKVRDNESSQLYPGVDEDEAGEGEFPFAIVDSAGTTNFGNYAQARLSFAQGGTMTPTCASYPFEPACKTGTASANTKIRSGSGVDMYFLTARMKWKKPPLFDEVEVAALIPIKSFSNTMGEGRGYELFDYLTYGRNPIDTYAAMYKFGKFGAPVFLFSIDPITDGQFLGVSISTYKLPEGFRIPTAGLDGSGSYTTNCFVDGTNMAGSVRDDIFVYIDETTMGSPVSGGYIDGIERIELYRTEASLILGEFTP